MAKLSNLSYLLLFLSLSFSACKETSKEYTLTVLSGNNQSGEINSSLPLPVVVQLTRGEDEIAYKTIKFESTTGQTESFTTDENGKVSFTWKLNCGLGNQSLLISALEPGIVLAQTNANASSQLPDEGYFKPCGIPNTLLYARFIFETQNGKIFSGNQQIYASDDNGFNWYVVGGLANVYKMLQIGNNLYALSNNGIYRSSNEGISWNQWTFIQAKTLAKAGNLWYVVQLNGDAYISADEGLNWYLAGGNSIQTPIEFLFSNQNQQVVGLSPSSGWFFIQDSLIQARELLGNTMGYMDMNTLYFGQEGYVYAVPDTQFTSASIVWNAGTGSGTSSNLKKINGSLHLSHFSQIYRQGSTQPVYSEAQLSGRILDYYVSPSQSYIVSHEGQGIFVKP